MNAQGCRVGDSSTQGTGHAGAGDSENERTEGAGFFQQRSLLREQATAADAVNLASISCRADAMSVREVLK
jgi:hypothetical protein